MTEAARVKLKRTPLDLIARHAVNDHGLITVRQRRSNELSMRDAGTIISRYRINPSRPDDGFVIVETSETWTTTLVKLESE